MKGESGAWTEKEGTTGMKEGVHMERKGKAKGPSSHEPEKGVEGST